jgi:hypothetical protein
MVGSTFLYLKNHRVVPVEHQRPIYVQRIVNLRHVQWVEYDNTLHMLRLKMQDVSKPDEYICDVNEDPATAKRVFYDIVKELRSAGKVLEW